MWPYMIRLNPTGVTVLTITCIIIYFVYSTSFSGSSKTKNGFIHNVDVDFGSESVNLKKLLIAAIKAAELGGKEVVKVRESNHLNEKIKGKTREGVNDVLTQGDMKSHLVMVQGLSASFTNLKIISEEHSNDNKYDVEFSPIHVNKDDMNYGDFNQLDNDDAPLKELTVWIDPLDATKEYTENLSQYVTTMVCIARNGDPIIGVIHKPFEGVTYWSWTGHGTSHNIRSALSDKNVNNNTSLRIIVSRSHSGDINTVIKSAFNGKAQVIPAAGSGFKTIELIKGNADAYVHITLIKKWDICAPNAILNAIHGKMTTLTGDIIKYDDDDVSNENGIIATLKNHNDFVKVFKDIKTKS